MHVALPLKKVAPIGKGDLHLLQRRVIGAQIAALNACLRVSRHGYALGDVAALGRINADSEDDVFQ